MLKRPSKRLCPKCGGGMRNGALYPADAVLSVKWASADDIASASADNPFLLSSYCVAYSCDKCGYMECYVEKTVQ